MSSAKNRTRARRSSTASLGRSVPPRCKVRTRGTLTVRQTFGGINAPAAAPARIAEARTRFARRRNDESTRILGRHDVEEVLLDAEERGDGVQGFEGGIDQLLVAQHVDLRFREEAVQVFELLAVEAQVAVVPERSPSIRDAGVLGRACSHEVADGFEAVRPRVHPVRIRTIDRITDDDHELGVGNRVGDPQLRAAVVQVERRALAAQGIGRRVGEERGVVVEAADPLLDAVRVAGALLATRPTAVAHEELRFLDARHVQARMCGRARCATRSCPPSARRGSGSRAKNDCLLCQ